MKNPTFNLLAAVSADGKIARDEKHGSMWTSKEDKKFLHAFLDKCDAIVIGRKTYAIAKDALQKRACVVFSRKHKVTRIKNHHFINPEKVSLSVFLANKKYERIAVLGGTSVYDYFLKRRKVADLHLTVEPLLIGKGLPLFSLPLRKNIPLRFVTAKKINKGGTYIFHYKFKK